jgi:hypothetical protein
MITILRIIRLFKLKKLVRSTTHHVSARVYIKLFVLILIVFILKNINQMYARNSLISTLNLKLDLYNSKIYSDFNVNSSSYLEDYNSIQNKKKTSNVKFNQFKTVIENKRPVKMLNNSLYNVLVYTKVFGNYKFCDKSSTPIQQLNECPYKNCHFTCDRSEIYRVNAVIFHEFDLYKETIEDFLFLKRLSRSKIRSNQLWILWNDEVLQ